MSSTAEKTDPALWEKVKAEITAGEKGGEKDEWSARKAQMAVQAYKQRGGGYKGKKAADNHLAEWTTAKKRADTKKGKQVSAQPHDVAKKTAPYRKTRHGEERTKADLYAEAKKREIPGRSTMSKAELETALKR